MITLSSDFGWPYPAAMRGVIAGRSDARIIDITHQFPRGDIHTAAFWLREILPYFPPAVHLGVVDPGVGTERGVIAIEAGDHVLVGPDNGVLRPAALALGDPRKTWDLVEVEAESHTFHGRDVFAPLAARIHDAPGSHPGALPDMEPNPSPVELTFPEPTIQDDLATGEILVVDVFGNAITNLPGSFLEPAFDSSIVVNNERVPAVRTYGAVSSGDRLATVGSHDHIELAVRDGRGADAFDVSRGDAVTIRRD